ncbi:MAG: PCRF domain-containing protein [Patescibacteria group bacterium]|nr:PCRF domain-containing protein [Patescibacteria group bacterium]
MRAEIGGHRIQRIPPTERRGRVHTSTVTVSVMDGAARPKVVLREADIKVEWFSGTGKGGQHRNKHQNCCRMLHVPSGTVQVANGRERTANYREAWTALERRLNGEASASAAAVERGERREQRGSGMRGDKRRTYRFRDDLVADHVTGRTAPCSRVMRGYFDLLW